MWLNIIPYSLLVQAPINICFTWLVDNFPHTNNKLCIAVSFNTSSTNWVWTFLCSALPAFYSCDCMSATFKRPQRAKKYAFTLLSSSHWYISGLSKSRKLERTRAETHSQLYECTPAETQRLGRLQRWKHTEAD